MLLSWLPQRHPPLANEDALGCATEVAQQRFSEKVQALFIGDLVGQFDREARGLAALAPEEAVVHTLQQWEDRLAGSTQGAEGKLLAMPSEVLAALLRSGALITAINVLVQSPVHAKSLAARTEFVEGGGRLRPKEALLRVLARVSSLPQDGLDMLITSLAQAHEDVARHKSGAENAAGLALSAAQNAACLHRLLESAFAYGQEQDGRCVEPRCKVWAAEDEDPVEAARNRRPSRWRRARVKQVGGDHMEVEWIDSREDGLQSTMATSSASVAEAAGDEGSTVGSRVGTPGSGKLCAAAAVAGVSRGPAQPAPPPPGSAASRVAEEAARCQELRALFTGNLREMRDERQREAEALDTEAMGCNRVVQSCQPQVQETSASLRSELEALRKRREARQAKMASPSELLQQKTRLLSELREVDEQLAAAESTSRRLFANERRLEEPPGRQEVAALAEQAAAEVEVLAHELWNTLGVCDHSTPNERQLYDDALGLKERCRELLGRLQCGAAPNICNKGTAGNGGVTGGAAGLATALAAPAAAGAGASEASPVLGGLTPEQLGLPQTPSMPTSLGAGSPLDAIPFYEYTGCEGLTAGTLADSAAVGLGVQSAAAAGALQGDHAAEDQVDGEPTAMPVSPIRQPGWSWVQTSVLSAAQAQYFSMDEGEDIPEGGEDLAEEDTAE